MTERPITPADAANRERIVRDLGTNLLVEAGAGSGKTYSLAARMAAGIACDHYKVHEIAAVTFTRKAAAELRGRFQLALEERLAGTPPAAEVERLQEAIAHLEQFFAGTIHAFCARLLRERPVEAGMAPDFTEMDEVEDALRASRAWRDYAAREGAPVTRCLRDVGVRPADLDATFARICEHEDVVFPPGDATMPDVAAAWRALEAFWTEAQRWLPATIDPECTCDVLKLAPTFRSQFRSADRGRPYELARLLEPWKRCKVVQKWWGDGAHGKRSGKGTPGRHVKELVDRFQSDVVAPFITSWRAWVYRQLMTLLADARRFYADERRRENVVNYVDLLMVAAKMLREHTAVRRALQAKYRWLFIDEFQDTDPIQAEVFLLLAADEAQLGETPGSVDWTTVPLRPGALFVVGDPKQSIYRFRRADIEIYNRVRERIVACGGAVLPLTANFRSVPAVCEFANRVFPARFRAVQGTHGPEFSALDPVRVAPTNSGPALLTHTAPADLTGDAIASWEAENLARWIGAEVSEERWRYRDFLILTRFKPRLRLYAAALERAGIPVEVSGAGMFGGSEEVQGLREVLQALADPLDAAATVGALRGALFGFSDVELFQYAQADGRFDLLAPLPEHSGSAASQSAGSRLGPVLDGMRTLQALYHRMRRLPLGAAIEHLLEETGWFALAVATDGGAGAGDLLQAVDRVRQVGETGGTLADAIAALEDGAKQANEVEALPLEPGRRDVVRLMNLHKAKGLEARVVVLADPTHDANCDPEIRLARLDGQARGWLRIAKAFDSGAKTTIGEPADWPSHAAAEKPFLLAEQERLFYVAATRARDLLVVGKSANPKANKAWKVFDPHLAGVKDIDVPPEDEQEQPGKREQNPANPARADVELTEAGRLAATRAREARHAAAVQASWAVERVTDEVHQTARVNRIRRTVTPTDATSAVLEENAGDPTEALLPDTPSHGADAGAAWGTLIHGLLEHAMRRPEATREDLLRLARWLTFEEKDQRSSIDHAVECVMAVMQSPFWAEAHAGRACHVEVPFAIRLPGTPVPGAAAPGDRVRDVEPARAVHSSPAGRVRGRAKQVVPGQGLLFDDEPVVTGEPPMATKSDSGEAVGGTPTIVRGVIDLVYQEGDGWRIVDYKTDQVNDASALVVPYGPQITRYAEAWTTVSGAPITRTSLFSVRRLESADV